MNKTLQELYARALFERALQQEVVEQVVAIAGGCF